MNSRLIQNLRHLVEDDSTMNPALAKKLAKEIDQFAHTLASYRSNIMGKEGGLHGQEVPLIEASLNHLVKFSRLAGLDDTTQALSQALKSVRDSDL